jgi:drug/metabolite transporter (DMT)-like permease
VLFKEQISLAKMAALGMIIFGVVVLNLSGTGKVSPTLSTEVTEITAPELHLPAHVLLVSEVPGSIRMPSR